MHLLQSIYAAGPPGHRYLLVEGFGVTVVATVFAAFVFPAEASLISICLVTVATIDSMDRLLQWNQRQIRMGGVRPNLANRALIARILSFFAGSFVGFSAVALVLPVERIAQIFSHQLGEMRQVAFADVVFGPAPELAEHNLWVMLFFFLVALFFRQGGVMVAVCWNASVWASVFALLARRWSEDGGPFIAEAWVRVMIACVPHMLLEAVAYVLAGFAGVFLSQALTRYTLRGGPWKSLLGSLGAMGGIALLILVVGAVWEAHVAQWMVSVLST